MRMPRDAWDVEILSPRVPWNGLASESSTELALSLARVAAFRVKDRSQGVTDGSFTRAARRLQA